MPAQLGQLCQQHLLQCQARQERMAGTLRKHPLWSGEETGKQVVTALSASDPPQLGRQPWQSFLCEVGKAPTS